MPTSMCLNSIPPHAHNGNCQRKKRPLTLCTVTFGNGTCLCLTSWCTRETTIWQLLYTRCACCATKCPILHPTLATMSCLRCIRVFPPPFPFCVVANKSMSAGLFVCVRALVAVVSVYVNDVVVSLSLSLSLSLSVRVCTGYGEEELRVLSFRGNRGYRYWNVPGRSCSIVWQMHWPWMTSSRLTTSTCKQLWKNRYSAGVEECSLPFLSRTVPLAALY